MRSLERARLSVTVGKGTATLAIALIERGKTLPFRVEVKHTLTDNTVNVGCLAAVATEEEGREQYEFHVEQAHKKGWGLALPSRLTLLEAVPDPPSDDDGARVLAPPPEAPAWPAQEERVA